MISFIYCIILIKFVDNKTVSYFRGRKLHGKQLKVPKGYRGVVLSLTDQILPKESPSVMAEDDQDAEETPEVKVMEEQSEFDNIMVWGHEALPEDTTDPYVRGMEEWIAFAREVCCPSL
jgi:ribonuclease H2 subunit C